MEREELETKAEQYKRELMKLYGKSCGNAAQEPENPSQDEKFTDDENLVEVNEEEITDAAEETHGEEIPLPYRENSDSSEELEDKFPDPDISEIYLPDKADSDPPESTPEKTNIESMGSASGFIRVNVRTGRDSGIVEGANVLVTATVNGKKLVLASDKTDLSGSTRSFVLPAPDEVYSQSPDTSVRPYSLFDVSVTADGFFNSISVDVPVFAGITSVQDFNLVPVPLMMSSSDETIVYYNQEPELSAPSQTGG